MNKILRTAVAVPVAAFLLVSSSFGQSGQSAKEDLKDAGRETKKAAVHTGRAVKKGSKKAVNKTASATEKGAEKVKDKTKP